MQEQYCRLITEMSKNLDGRMGLLRSDAMVVLIENKAFHAGKKGFLALASKTEMALETGQVY